MPQKIAQAQDTYVVDSENDDEDDNPGDGNCDDGSGNCTLRAAIMESNDDADRDSISFENIPTTGGFATISLSNGALEIEEETDIAGSTAPGYPSDEANGPIVKIDGNSISDAIIRFDLSAENSRIRGFAITNGEDEGISIGGVDEADNVTVRDCFVGLDVDGSTEQGNLQNPTNPSNSAAIAIFSDNATIDGNVVSGNGGDGIFIDDDDKFNRITNNTIGLDHDGDTAKGNDGRGVMVTGNVNTVGDAFFDLNLFRTFDNGNAISANGEAGVYVQSDSNQVSANEIGTRFDGSSATGTEGNSLGNQIGIRVEGTGTGSDAAERNMIGREEAPTNFFLNIDPSAAADRNLVSGNAGPGIRLGDGGAGNASLRDTLRGNVIGLNATRDAPISNGNGTDVSGGIVGSQTSRSVIDSNNVSGNAGHGIIIFAASGGMIDIVDNVVGTNNSFATGLGNDFDGIQVKPNPSANSFEIEIEENIIGNNSRDGVDIRGSYHDMGSNYIGVAPDSTDIGNGRRGVIVDNGSSRLEEFTMGGIFPVAGDGEAAGFSTPNGDGNVIGHNGEGGILIRGAASDFSIQETYVGTNQDGADFGNGGTANDGIRIVGDGNTSAGHRIGYNAGESFSNPDPAEGGDGNVIAFNGGDGISLGSSESSSDVDNVSVRGNSTFQNGGDTPQLGIDLGNSGDSGGTSPPSTNDNGDGDDGPNNMQNHPVNFDVTNCDDSSTPTTVDITFTVRSNTGGGNASSYPLKVDFYAADSEASGEGKTYIQTEEYSSSSANSSYGFQLSTSEATCEDHFVATATDANGNTSEFFGPPGQQLPVELASFEGTQTGEGAVKLTWTTASEQNNSGFEIQRRERHSPENDNVEEKGRWSKVGFVESKASGGTATKPMTYQFTTEDVAVGTYEFRLRQVDLSGATHPHDPVTVELQMEEALRLSAPAPNPVRDGTAEVTFAVREQAETTIQLFNTLGQQMATVYRGTPTAGESTTTRLRADDLPSGVYFLRLRAGDRSTTQRLTIVR